MEFKVNKLLNDLMTDMAQIAYHVDDLFVLGYDQHFELIGDKLMCMRSRDMFYARELTVDHLYHVQGIGYLYGIRHRNTNLRGIFVYYTTQTLQPGKHIQDE